MTIAERVDAPLRVVIVDDEALARTRLRRLLAGDDAVELVGEADTGVAAVDVIRREHPDLVLLDVQMPDLDGFGVLAALGGDFAGQVVFVTAYESHALRAFEVNAVDYLLKPVAADRLRAALARARGASVRADVVRRHEALLAMIRDMYRVGSGEERDAGAPVPDPAAVAPLVPAELSTVGAPIERFLVKTGDRSIVVRADDVDCFEAEANYVRLRVGRQSYLMRATMAGLEQGLDGARFVRIHRETIVNLDRVKEVAPWFSGDHLVTLRDGTKLRMSRSYAARLLSRMRVG